MEKHLRGSPRGEEGPLWNHLEALLTHRMRNGEKEHILIPTPCACASTRRPETPPPEHAFSRRVNERRPVGATIHRASTADSTSSSSSKQLLPDRSGSAKPPRQPHHQALRATRLPKTTGAGPKSQGRQTPRFVLRPCHVFDGFP